MSADLPRKPKSYNETIRPTLSPEVREKAKQMAAKDLAEMPLTFLGWEVKYTHSKFGREDVVEIDALSRDGRIQFSMGYISDLGEDGYRVMVYYNFVYILSSAEGQYKTLDEAKAAVESAVRAFESKWKGGA